MPVPDSDQPQSDAEHLKKAVRDFRFLASALDGAAEFSSRGAPPRTELLELTGWTIYLAAKDGLLETVLDLTGLDGSGNVLKRMDQGIPQVLKEDELIGPPVHRDGFQSIEHYLQDLQGNAASQMQIEGDQAAEQLVGSLWRWLAPKIRDQLPDDIAESYLTDPYLLNHFFGYARGFRIGAYLCRHLADRLARQTVGKSEGWLTVTDSETLTGVNRGLITRACEDGKIETNGEKGLARRISLPSLITFMKRKLDKGEKSERSAIRKWVCKRCDQQYDEMPARCTKCGADTFVLGRQQF